MALEYETFTYTKERIEQRIAFNKEAIQILANSDEIRSFSISDDVTKFITSGLVRSMLNSISRHVDGFENVYIHFPGGQIIQSDHEMAHSLERFLALRSLVETYDLDSDFYGIKLLQVQTTTAYNNSIYAIVAPIHTRYLTEAGNRFTGACIAYFNTDCFLQDFPPSGSPYILTHGNQIILGTDSDFIDSFNLMLSSNDNTQPDCGNINLNGANYQLLSLPIGGTEWVLHSFHSTQDNFTGFSPFGERDALMITIAIFALLALVVMIYRFIVNPIEDITRQTDAEDVRKGGIINPNKNRNELTRLTQGINSMLERVDNLNQDIIMAKQSLYQTNMALLKEKCMFWQAQINPHFLYNNLECIRGMAAIGDENGIREIVGAMSSIYRYCAESNQNSTVRDELDCIIFYFKIIMLRYSDMFTFELDIDESILDLSIPRMALEPIVENAIIHGFVRAGRSSGHVCISGKYEFGNLILIVSDNGVGIKDDLLDELNSLYKGFTQDDIEMPDGKIGLVNVNSRIKLLHGLNSGLHLRSNGNGLDIIISIEQNI